MPLYIRQALDPHLQHGPCKLSHASGAGHSLPGACPLDPLVLMFNPSFGTHFSSQFWCTSFIWIINVILRPGLITQHSLHSAMPCQGQAPGPPSTHFLFLVWYTCLISLLLVMFYLSYQTYTLACTNGMALAACQGKPSQSTSLIPVLTQTFYLNHQS